MATYEMTLYLSNFIGCRVESSEDEYGNIEEGIFIPIDRNGLIRTKENKYLVWGFVQELDVPSLGFSHRVMLKTNPAHVRQIQEKGIDVPCIARMKPTKFYHRKPTNINTRVDIEDGIDI